MQVKNEFFSCTLERIEKNAANPCEWRYGKADMHTAPVGMQLHSLFGS